MTEWRTAWVNEVPYPGNGEIYTIASGTLYVSYTFPELIMTILKPGDIIIQVSLRFIIYWYKINLDVSFAVAYQRNVTVEQYFHPSFPSRNNVCRHQCCNVTPYKVNG